MTYIPDKPRRGERIAGLRWLLLLAGAFLAAGPSPAGAQTSKEYQLKAAFLFNFTQYIEWPASAFHDANAPIRIGVLGDDPFGPLLDQIVQGETVHDRKLTVKRLKNGDDLRSCQLLFISKSERPRAAEILAALDDASVLTVSEIDGFASRGGVINFYLDENKVRFEINPDAAQRRGLKISSQLLKVARIVGRE